MRSPVLLLALALALPGCAPAHERDADAGPDARADGAVTSSDSPIDRPQACPGHEPIPCARDQRQFALTQETCSTCVSVEVMGARRGPDLASECVGELPTDDATLRFVRCTPGSDGVVIFVTLLETESRTGDSGWYLGDPETECRCGEVTWASMALDSAYSLFVPGAEGYGYATIRLLGETNRYRVEACPHGCTP